jgi:hypothetical protein
MASKFPFCIRIIGWPQKFYKSYAGNISHGLWNEKTNKSITEILNNSQIIFWMKSTCIGKIARYLITSSICILLFFRCEKETEINPDFNMSQVDSFLYKITSSNRFLIVSLRDFDKTSSTDKVVLALRHDMDANMAACLEMASIEHKYNIRASYFVLHTASYYGNTKFQSFERNNNLIHDLKTIQDHFGQEVGWHNDLVTLQVVYDILPKAFLKNELNYLKSNGINIYGTVAHGSPFCYKYHYSNNYFWEGNTASEKDFFYNWEYVPKDNKIIKLEKAVVADYMEYDGNQIKSDYFFHDVEIEGKRWNMKMINFDTIQPGKKVIILLHPEHWYP